MTAPPRYLYSIAMCLTGLNRSLQEVSVRDLGSLHGISLNGVDLVQWQSKPVSSGDTVVVGSEIVRGTSMFAHWTLTAI